MEYHAEADYIAQVNIYFILIYTIFVLFTIFLASAAMNTVSICDGYLGDNLHMLYVEKILI